MNEVYVIFNGTDREGPVASGTYVLDAARRMGVKIDCDCASEEPSGSCAVKILKGTPFLSTVTAVEKEQLDASERKDKQRLACQTKLEKPGEVEIMVVKEDKKEEVKDDSESRAEAFKKDFSEMPLDKKFASLVEIEAMALSDAFSYVLNSPYEAVGKVVEVMSGFGRKKEDRERDAKVPDEHKPAEEASGEAGVKDKKKAPASKTRKKATGTTKRKTTKRSTASKKTSPKKVENKDEE